MDVMEIDRSEFKILVVDDVTTNILLLKVMLNNERFNVITANSGEEAIRITKEKHPDLILLDVMMPGMNGFEVARQLKNDDSTKEIAIIFLTALNSAADIVKGFQLGGSDFISKPFNKDELIIRVTHQLSLVAAKRIILQKTNELEETIQGRDKLYSVIAHDLRSPLGSVKMVLNMLLMSVDQEIIGKEMYAMVADCNQITEDVFDLLDNLLKWTKSQTGRLHVAFQVFDVGATADGVRLTSTMVGKAKNIEVHLHKDEGLISSEVKADADMVKTVLRNLMSNALKFSNENSEIVIGIANYNTDQLVISVKDSGKGISKENQLKLLNKETHYSTFGTKNEEGSGLGLLLCKDFVEKNGGKLWFESKEGQGSTFYFTLNKK
jgi:two-component system sensor histidine kinase/response regulator